MCRDERSSALHFLHHFPQMFPSPARTLNNTSSRFRRQMFAPLTMHSKTAVWSWARVKKTPSTRSQASRINRKNERKADLSSCHALENSSRFHGFLRESRAVRGTCFLVFPGIQQFSPAFTRCRCFATFTKQMSRVRELVILPRGLYLITLELPTLLKSTGNGV